MKHQKRLAINYRRSDSKKHQDVPYVGYKPEKKEKLYKLHAYLYKYTVLDREFDNPCPFEQFHIFSSVEKAMAFAQGVCDHYMSDKEWETVGSIPLIFTKTDSVIDTYIAIVDGRYKFEIHETFTDHTPWKKEYISKSGFSTIPGSKASNRNSLTVKD